MSERCARIALILCCLAPLLYAPRLFLGPTTPLPDPASSTRSPPVAGQLAARNTASSPARDPSLGCTMIRRPPRKASSVLVKQDTYETSKELAA